MYRRQFQRKFRLHHWPQCWIWEIFAGVEGRGLGRNSEVSEWGPGQSPYGGLGTLGTAFPEAEAFWYLWNTIISI